LDEPGALRDLLGTYHMGRCAEVREQLHWMREHVDRVSPWRTDLG
jgi:hypothetical protein